jgi:hypothetical protein
MNYQPPSIYVRLARMMSGDKNLAIFRRFDDANILCLLSLQAEILQLRKEFHWENSLDETDGTEQEKKYGRSFYDSQKNNSAQHQILCQLQETLTRYSMFKE